MIGGHWPPSKIKVLAKIRKQLPPDAMLRSTWNFHKMLILGHITKITYEPQKYFFSTCDTLITMFLPLQIISTITRLSICENPTLNQKKYYFWLTESEKSLLLSLEDCWMHLVPPWMRGRRLMDWMEAAQCRWMELMEGT